MIFDMRKVIFNVPETETIYASDIPAGTPIFIKRDGELYGMVFKEDAGWICRVGDGFGANGHHETAEKCMKSCLGFGYEFFVN